MQTMQVLSTIKWIKSVVGPEAERMMFARAERQDPAAIPTLLYHLGRISYLLSTREDAKEVLAAFKLTALLDNEKLIKFFSNPVPERTPEFYDALTSPWRTMSNCVAPFERLIVPKVLTDHVESPEILSLEMRDPHHGPVDLSRLTKASAAIQKLYMSVATAYGTKKEGALELIKIESGSDIRIDLKGVADVVKHVKDLLLEGWHKLRHMKAEDLTENSKAAASSLAVIAQIAKLEKDGDIAPADADILRHQIMTSIYDLFSTGVLILEIPPIELVQNDKLLAGFMPRQIEGPKQVQTDGTDSPPKQRKHKANSRRGQIKKKP